MAEALVAAVEAAWEEGSPVAGGDPHAVAAYADRRMRSFERRAKKSKGRLARIDDLGKGLAQFFGDADSWSTPLKQDLRYLAAKIFDASVDAPWNHARDLYPAGSTVHGIVVDVQPFGVFVSLADTKVHGIVKVPDLFPLHDGPAPQADWPALDSRIVCAVISHGEGRNRIDLRPLRHTTNTNDEVFTPQRP